MTYGLDTSALMRVLVGQPADLAERVNTRLASLIDMGHEIRISDLAVSEAYYVLQDYYELTKEQAVEALSSLTSTPGFVLSPEVTEALSTPNLAHASPGFIDRVLALGHIHDGETVIACEKSFKKLENAEVIV